MTTICQRALGRLGARDFDDEFDAARLTQHAARARCGRAIAAGIEKTAEVGATAPGDEDRG